MLSVKLFWFSYKELVVYNASLQSNNFREIAMTKIKFGTDGWRAVVGEDFTPENVRQVIQAFCDVYPTLPEKGRPVVVGYDRRNQSPETAQQIAEVLLGNDIPTILSETFCPTPTVSWMVKHHEAAAGIMVTASHNPPTWNGIKFKESYGGAASGEYLKPIEERIEKNMSEEIKPKVAKLKKNKKLTMFDPYGEYLQAVAELVDMEKIRSMNYRILMDPMYGSGAGYLPKLLGEMVEEIHAEDDVNFGGLNPEPIPPHLNELVERVKTGNYDVGLATDGDADRAGAVDEEGNFITTHEVFSLIIRHLLENKGWTGGVIKSISTTVMIDRLGETFGFEVDTVPVGFKHICPAMQMPGVLMGGEESGGYGIPKHIPERDGVFSDLLLLEMMAMTKKSLGTLVKELQNDVGPCRYRRLDLHSTQDQIEAVREKMKTFDINEIGGRKVVKHTTIDGHHFGFEDDSWLLFRVSGTEPLVRLYAEAPSFEQVEEMLKEGKKMIGVE
jgi:phosphomannomutase